MGSLNHAVHDFVLAECTEFFTLIESVAPENSSAFQCREHRMEAFIRGFSSAES